MSSPTKVGVIGLSKTGWAATALAPSLFSIPDKFNLVAVSTTSAESAQASAKEYSEAVGHPVKAYHGDSSQLSEDPDVDLVVVTVKAPYHLKTVLPVIESGKDFFIEWPAGANYAETKRIHDKARTKGMRTIVGLQSRQSPTLQKVDCYFRRFLYIILKTISSGQRVNRIRQNRQNLIHFHRK